jgi:hypothetical protein
VLNVSEENWRVFDIYQMSNIYCLLRLVELLGIDVDTHAQACADVANWKGSDDR